MTKKATTPKQMLAETTKKGDKRLKAGKNLGNTRALKLAANHNQTMVWDAS